MKNIDKSLKQILVIETEVNGIEWAIEKAYRLGYADGQENLELYDEMGRYQEKEPTPETIRAYKEFKKGIKTINE